MRSGEAARNLGSVVNQDGERILRESVAKFLQDPAPHHLELAAAIQLFRQQPWQAVLFGGLLRDLVAVGPKASPRDIDIVVRGASGEDLESAFESKIRRKTRFGGYVMSFGGWRFDVWPLEVTWAFRNKKVEPQTLDMLPCTTFLNVEAVAMTLDHEAQESHVYACGFFEGIEARVIEVNLEDNPYPELCIVRSLHTAAKLDFALGPRLVQYICRYMGQYTIAELLAVQEAHYGMVRRSARALDLWLHAVRSHAGSHLNTPLRLPRTDPVQLEVWEGSNWDFADVSR